MFRDYWDRFWNVVGNNFAVVVIVVIAATVISVAVSLPQNTVTVRQVVIVKGFTPLSLQAAVNQMLIDSSFVNVRLDYASLPRWDVVMISHDVQVDE